MPAVKKRRVGRPRSKSAPAVLRSLKRPRKRKQWPDEAMVAALKAVKGGESILRAARTYGVPRSTLQDRVHGKVTHGVKPGPRPYLAPAEEKELSMCIVDVTKAGYGKTRKKRKTADKNDVNIDPNQCCVCFRTFEEDEMEKNGMEWVECVCKRWLHEACIDYVTNVDVDGKELLCPYCCV